MMAGKAQNSVEEELNAIRLKLYEEVRGMTPEEIVAYLNVETEPIIRQYGSEQNGVVLNQETTALAC